MLTQEDVLSAYLKPEQVLFLDADRQEEIIKQMVEHLVHQKLIDDQESFLKAIMAREALVSTGVGRGSAIPHAKSHQLKEFFVSIAVIKKPGVDWKSFDQVPVTVVVLIGGPANDPNRYLKILSAITMAIRSDDFRQDLAYCKTAHEVLKLFERN